MLKKNSLTLLEVLNEGNHVIDYATGYEDAMADLPQNSDDPWYAAGYADFLEGIHDQYEALLADGSAPIYEDEPAPRAPSRQPMGEANTLSKSQIKNIIRQEKRFLTNSKYRRR